MDATLRDLLEAPPATETFTLAPGVELTLRGAASYARIQALHAEAEALRRLQAVRPLTCGGETVEVTEDTCNAAVLLASGAVEPSLSVSDALRIAHRFPLKFVEAVQVVARLSGAEIAAQTDAAARELGANPTEPPVSG